MTINPEALRHILNARLLSGRVQARNVLEILGLVTTDDSPGHSAVSKDYLDQIMEAYALMLVALLQEQEKTNRYLQQVKLQLENMTDVQLDDEETDE